MKNRLFLGDKTVQGNPVAHYVRFAIYLYIFWLIISGSLQLKFLLMGAVSCIVIAWVCTPLFMIDNISHTKKYFLLDIPLISLIGYAVWLLKELILANIDVAKSVWKKQMPIEPELIHFRVSMDNPVALALLANSITLTPGTITLNVSRENIYEIHALTPTAAEGIRSGSMAKKIGKLFRTEDGFELLKTPCEECPICKKYKEDNTCV